MSDSCGAEYLIPREAWAARRERFWKRCIKRDGINGCWEWTGRIDPTGYGRMFILKREYRVHRLALMDGGIPLPAGTVVDHICRNRSCIRPDHLRVVTWEVNATENSSSPWAVRKARTHCPHGHPLDGIRTQTHKSSGRRFVGRRCNVCNAIGAKKRRDRAMQEAK